MIFLAVVISVTSQTWFSPNVPLLVYLFFLPFIPLIIFLLSFSLLSLSHLSFQFNFPISPPIIVLIFFCYFKLTIIWKIVSALKYLLYLLKQILYLHIIYNLKLYSHIINVNYKLVYLGKTGFFISQESSIEKKNQNPFLKQSDILLKCKERMFCDAISQ